MKSEIKDGILFIQDERIGGDTNELGISIEDILKTYLEHSNNIGNEVHPKSSHKCTYCGSKNTHTFYKTAKVIIEKCYDCGSDFV